LGLAGIEDSTDAYLLFFIILLYRYSGDHSDALNSKSCP
jgi:hypothetical protein